MIQIITGAAISFVITIFLLPVLIRFAGDRKLFVVRHYRTVHHGDISSLGGIAIFSGVIFALVFFGEFTGFYEIKYYLAAGSFVFLVGLRDDLHNVSPAGKLLGQLIAGFIIVVPGDMRITSLNSFFTNPNLQYISSVLLTIFIIIWFINAYNFFDGIDMQAAMLGIVVILPSAFWFYYAHQYNFSLMLFATSAALLAFLFYNYYPSKIFMGDTGTVTIGFILAFGFIKFVNMNKLPELDTFRFSNPFLFGLLLMQLPLFDSFRVVVTRIFRGSSPFLANKNHIHHLLLKLGLKQPVVALISVFYTVFVLMVNLYLFADKQSLFVISIINITILSIFYFIIFYGIKKKARQHRHSGKEVV